jgi:cytochrome c oxidase subunit III
VRSDQITGHAASDAITTIHRSGRPAARRAMASIRAAMAAERDLTIGYLPGRRTQSSASTQQDGAHLEVQVREGDVMTTTAAHEHVRVAWPPDAQYGAATPGKIGMWVFLVSDAFAFGGLLIAQGILRSGRPEWVQPGEPTLGIPFTAALTFLLISTSFTNVMAWAAAAEDRRRSAATLLALTALGGLLFLVGQYHEWTGLIREGLVLGRSSRASTFYVITGFHGLHVLAGVIYILAVLGQYARGRATAHHVELLGLYWCFVDFVWIFVFSFVYLMP